MINIARYHVATGTYYISKKSPLILEAFLGTCVGVALYDKTAGIGGIIHLLLPEPVATTETADPDRYAATGMPRFIEAMKSAGALPSRMRAWIAGGALVEPLTRQDIALDIGGRTADIVTRFLTAEGIKIENEETGGFFTCTLNLNLKTWEVSIQPAGFEKHKAARPANPPAPEQITGAIQYLQPIPQVALKIMRMINEDACDFKQIAHSVRQDQVITAKTLQLCNSAFFAGRNKIDTLEDALIILGQDQLVKSILQVAINNYFSQSGTGYALCKGGLFHHAVGTAVIAEKLSSMTGKALPAVAYTAGLLHDIGMVVLDRYVMASFPMFYRSMQYEGRNILAVENEIFGIDHPGIGRQLATQWSFPDSLTEVITYHHQPEKSAIVPELTHIVYLAELLMSRFHTGLELERSDTDNFIQRLAVLGLSIDDFTNLVDLMPQAVFWEKEEQEPENEAE